MKTLAIEWGADRVTLEVDSVDVMELGALKFRIKKACDKANFSTSPLEGPGDRLTIRIPVVAPAVRSTIEQILEHTPLTIKQCLERDSEI